MVKNTLANAGDTRDVDLIPGLGQSPEVGHSCLENSMDRGAWWVTDDGVAKSQTRLSTQVKVKAVVLTKLNDSPI